MSDIIRDIAVIVAFYTIMLGLAWVVIEVLKW